MCIVKTEAGVGTLSTSWLDVMTFQMMRVLGLSGKKSQVQLRSGRVT